MSNRDEHRDRNTDAGRRPHASGVHRRDFLKLAAVGGAGGVVARWLPGTAHAAAETPSAETTAPAQGSARVVIIRRPGVLVEGYKVDREILAGMIDAGIRELTGAESDKAAWQSIAREGERVTMKYNGLGGPNIRTHAEMYEILAERFKEHARVEDAIAWDRQGIPVDKDGWGSETYELPSRGIKTKLRAIVTDWATCLVNLPVLKTHGGNGLTIAMKNHLGTNNNPGDLHPWDGGMWQSIAELNALEPIRTKTKLIVVDATRPLWDGGPGDRPANRWDENALMFAIDPVAVDTVGLGIIEAKREEVKGEPWPVTWGRKKVEYAGTLGIGVADPKRIEVVEKTLA